MLTNRTQVKRLVAELRPGLRVSAAYLAGLEARVHSIIESHVHRNGSKGTLRADVLIRIRADS